MTALQPQLIQGVIGETLKYECVVTRAQEPIDITGATIWMTAKRRFTDADPGVFQSSTVNGHVIVTNAAVGKFMVVIDPSWTASLAAPVDLHYDVKVKEQNGDENVPIFGTLSLIPNVTDAS